MGCHSHLMCLRLQGKEAAGTVPPRPRPRLLQCAGGHLPSEYPLLLRLSLPVCLRAHGGLPALTILVRVPHLPVALLPGVRRDTAGAQGSLTKCLLESSLSQAPPTQCWPHPQEAGTYPSMAWLPCLRLAFWTFPSKTLVIDLGFRCCLRLSWFCVAQGLPAPRCPTMPPARSHSMATFEWACLPTVPSVGLSMIIRKRLGQMGSHRCGYGSLVPRKGA